MEIKTEKMTFAEIAPDGYGTDADHLKTLGDIETALAAGMTMITLDLSDVMRPQASAFSETQVESEFAALPPSVHQASSRALSGA